MPALPERATCGLIAACFFLTCFFVYGASLRNDFVRFDDGLLIFENPIVRDVSFSNIGKAFTTYDPELYIPLTFLSYQLDYAIGGANAFIFHLHSLFLHTLNAILVAWFVFLLSWSKRTGMIVGLLWAIHPLNTEAVAWAAGLKDVQSTFFFFASLIAYAYYRSSGARKTYWTCVALFVLALLSKVNVLTLPAVLLLLEWQHKQAWKRRAAVDLWPFVGLSIMFGIIAIAGKTDVIASTTPWQTLLMAAKSTLFYIGSLLWPVHLSVLYPYDGAITLLSPDFYLPVLGVATLVAIAVATRRTSTAISFGIAFYLITLSPTFFNFSKVGITFIASDRYAYIPSVGLLFIVALLIDQLLLFVEQQSHARSWKWTLYSIGTGIFVLLAWTTGVQARTWSNTEALFRNVLRSYPSSFIARNNLGNTYVRQERWDDAIAEFETALETHEDVTLHNNLARAYGKKGLMDRAIAHFDRSIELEPTNPETYVELGRMYAERDLVEQALVAYAKAIELKPGYAVTYVNRASLLINSGRMTEAIDDLLMAIELDPAVPQSHYNLALAYTQQGNVDDAIRLYEEAIRLEPRLYEAHFNLGRLYAKQGRLHEARAALMKALRIKPGNATIESAIRQIDEALQNAR